MASTPPINEQFLREVDDELRREQALGLWKRWGRTALIAIAVALAGFAGYLFWQSQRDATRGVEGEKLTQALDKVDAGQLDPARGELAPLANSGSDAMRAAAKLTMAGIAEAKNDGRGAASQFAAIAADTSLPQAYRELALIRQTIADFDAVKPEVVVQRLTPLAVPGNPWFGSAGELIGMAYLKMGKREQAAKMFARVAADKNVPETIGSRAGQLAQISAIAPAAPPAAAPAKDSK